MAGAGQRMVQHALQPGFCDRRREAAGALGLGSSPRPGPANIAVMSPARKQSPAPTVSTTVRGVSSRACTASPSRCSSQAPSGPSVSASHWASVWLRTHGSLAKAEIARVTGFTAQTIGLITARLDEDELLRREAAVRGRVSPPSVPIGLNPEGVFAIGIMMAQRRLAAGGLHRPGA